MPGAHDACRVVDIQPHVAFNRALRFTRMQADAHLYHRILGPRVNGKGTLDVHRRTDGVAGAGKDDEEGVALRIHLLPLPLPESRSQHVPTLLQQSGIVFAHLLQQARGSFYIREE